MDLSFVQSGFTAKRLVFNCISLVLIYLFLALTIKHTLKILKMFNCYLC